MQRSSESIASLAAALAKAQAELVNPEKSRVATTRSETGRGPEQTFRYAPLSSGLDIVRKSLGQHGIATIETTAVDQTAGTANLTTMLAHASGSACRRRHHEAVASLSFEGTPMPPHAIIGQELRTSSAHSENVAFTDAASGSSDAEASSFIVEISSVQSQCMNTLGGDHEI